MLHAEQRNAPRTTRFRPGLVVAAVLLLGFVVLTVLAWGPLRSLDLTLDSERDLGTRGRLLRDLNRYGRPAVYLPLLVLVSGRAAYRAHSFRPLLVATVGVSALWLMVGGLKLGLGRGSPLQAEPDFMVGGMAYPSGHSAAVVLVYGLIAYLWCRYTGAPRRTRIALPVLVVVLTVAMVASSLLLRWHWFTDLLAGVLIGAAVLQATTTLDRAGVFSRQTPHAP